MDDTSHVGLQVVMGLSRSAAASENVEVNVGSDVPVAYSGLRRVLVALEGVAPEAIDNLRTTRTPEYNVLFPKPSLPSRDLATIADAPNQRRLFRESEQTFRVLNAAARAIVEGMRQLRGPLVLRNAGACDLVSIRGLMHAVQCSRLTKGNGTLVWSGWDVEPKHRSRLFSATRRDHVRLARARMQPRLREECTGPLPTLLAESSLECDYLTRTIDPTGALEHRLAAAIHSVRACFFSTNYEGAMLAAETALDLLDASGGQVRASALTSAWDELDDPQFDIPMVELDRSSLGNGEHLRALLMMHIGIVRVFTGQLQDALEWFGSALELDVAPEVLSDLRLYRALTKTKMMGDIAAARVDIEQGLAALTGRQRSSAATHEAWLHNLMALTYFQEHRLQDAQREEELSLACVDNMPGPSAAHLKTNLVSNFSVLYEAKGDIPMATRIWESFAALNDTLGSDAADKVYLNRLGALQREAGDVDAALQSYEGALRKAETTGDDFHAEIIAGAMARTYIERRGQGDLERAAGWYRTAAESARACGDCVRLSKDLAGFAVATKSTDFAEARGVLRRDTAHSVEADRFMHALLSDDTVAIEKELPRAKSKLSRPFSQVNL